MIHARPRLASGSQRRKQGEQGFAQLCSSGPFEANGSGEAARRRPLERRRATHVEAGVEVPRDRGSIPRASTFRGPAIARRATLFQDPLHPANRTANRLQVSIELVDTLPGSAERPPSVWTMANCCTAGSRTVPTILPCRQCGRQILLVVCCDGNEERVMSSL
jgi:hypothetical protein